MTNYMVKKKTIFPVFALLLSMSAFANNSAENKADNTKINERDRASFEKTADQQNQNVNDLQLTRRIRQAIMNEKDLSTYGQNVKVISVNGKVTLKGPVRTAQEQRSILKYARSAAGAGNVTNQMSVVPVDRN